jgi:hypothetical protein
LPPVTLPTLTRGRSRSFSAAIAKTLGKGSVPVLCHDPVPSLPRTTTSREEILDSSQTSLETRPKPGFLRTHSSGSSISTDYSREGTHSFDSISRPSFSESRPWLNGRTPSLSSKSSFRPAVSYRDFAEPTVNAAGMEFEIIQPRRQLPMLKTQIDSAGLGILTPSDTDSDSLLRRDSDTAPEELDEWGFIKHVAPTPEIFRSRQSASEVRAQEQKWVRLEHTLNERRRVVY